MSTIVAVEKAGRIALSWDNMSSSGSTRNVNHTGPPKVLRVGPSVIGVAGYSVYRNVLGHYLASKKPASLRDERSIFQFFVQFWRDLHGQYHFVNDEYDDEDPAPFADLGAEFLIVNPYGIFRIKEILSVSRFDKFCAIGSGAPHAEGALQVLYDQDGGAQDIAEAAVRVALQFDAASGGPVEVLEFRGRSTQVRRTSVRRRKGGKKGSGQERKGDQSG